MKTLGLLTMFGLLAAVTTAQEKPRTVVTEDSKITLEMEAAPIGAVLKLLATQNNLNIVSGQEVRGSVSLRLRQVSLDEALAAILLANGYTYSRQGNVLVVLSQEKDYPQQLETRVFELSYVSADYVAASLKSVLSPKGKTDIFTKEIRRIEPAKQAPATILVVTDFGYNIPRIEKIVAALDKPAKQVSIEVKMVETSLDKNSDLGLEWPEAIGASFGDAEPVSTSSTSTTTEASKALVFPVKGRPKYGRLSVAQVDWFLNYLATQTNSKLLSNPKVTTLDNQPAKITVATTIPLQTLNRFTEGAVVQDIVSFQDKEFGIILDVTPRVNDDSTVTLRVVPTVEDIISFTGPINNQRPITSKRSVETQIRMKDGETMVICGLIKDNEVKTVRKVWLLGDIPLLGNLFRSNSKQKNQTDLLIMITPRIVR
ncbi:MAG TPA: secretin and TonB N-terminal domain-containing protein [candidate division Zixibacteria bacterium]|nr:secretin and TonB N-terminal domain-containing protein [candidate division Zixibacteria bacterium]